MKVKPGVFPLLYVLLAFISSSAQAGIDFMLVGRIEPVSCTPMLGGSGWAGNAVELDEVNISSLAQGSSWGNSRLDFVLDGCEMSATKDYMWVYFNSGQVDSNGRIIPDTGTSQVRFEILDVDRYGVVGGLVRVGGMIGAAGPDGNQGTGAKFSGSGRARKTYLLRYYAHEDVTVPGSVSASVTYTLAYY